MFCKNCGQPIESGQQFCKNCGQELKVGKFFILTQWFRNHRKGILIIIGVIIFFVIVSIFSEDSSSPPTTQNIPTKQPSNNHVLTQEEIASSIVNIFCSNKEETIDTGGSGIIIAEEGGILTNYHVIAETDFCWITLPNPITGEPDEMYVATPVVVSELSEQYDLALLSITDAFVDEDGNILGTYPKKFKYFDDSAICSEYVPNLGENIRIYGYPVTSGGYNLTITEGIISSFGDDGLIFTSAKVDSGNSGGIAVNKNGCFVGIPSAVKTGEYQNLGVIIPSSVISTFATESQSQPFLSPQDDNSVPINKPEVKLFVMSFCPYGNQVEAIIQPLVNLFGDKINFRLDYVVSQGTDGLFYSLYGYQDLNEDVRELCIQKYQKNKLWDFVIKINKSCTFQNADMCWEGAVGELGINIQNIKYCSFNEYGTILKQELVYIKEYGVSNSPTLFINGVEYLGVRTSAAYKKAICQAFDTMPPECY